MRQADDSWSYPLSEVTMLIHCNELSESWCYRLQLSEEAAAFALLILRLANESSALKPDLSEVSSLIIIRPFLRGSLHFLVRNYIFLLINLLRSTVGCLSDCKLERTLGVLSPPVSQVEQDKLIEFGSPEKSCFLCKLFDEAGEILTRLKGTDTSQGLCAVILCIPYNQVHNETVDVKVTVSVMVCDLYHKSEYSQNIFTLRYY